MANKIKTLNRSGLVGEWKLDGNALDSAGSNNGTNTNGIYVTTDIGYQSQAWQGNGSNAYINLGNFTGVNGASSMSICAWVKKTTNSNYGMVISKGDVSASTGVFELRNDGTTGKFQFGVRSTGANLAQGATVVSTGVWTFIVGTYDTSGGINLYINGVLDGNNTVFVGGSINSQTTETDIGRRTDGFYFNGNIQTVKPFNRVLSLSEIEDLYKEGLRYLGGQSYGSLFDGLTAQIQSDFDNNIYDIVGGRTITRTGGTSTTDIFGNSNAISNPNYSWSSITYTTGYTFENSGGGWSIVTSPSGLSATGINRTTTLGIVFLFTRTLSASEITLLEQICKTTYPYPF